MAAHQIFVPNRCSSHGNRICGSFTVALSQPNDESTMLVPSHIHSDVCRPVFYSCPFRYVRCRSRWSHVTKMRILSSCRGQIVVFWSWQTRHTHSTEATVLVKEIQQYWWLILSGKMNGVDFSSNEVITVNYKLLWSAWKMQNYALIQPLMHSLWMWKEACQVVILWNTQRRNQWKYIHTCVFVCFCALAESKLCFFEIGFWLGFIFYSGIPFLLWKCPK